MLRIRVKKIIDYLPFVVFIVAIAVRLIALTFPFGDFDEGVYLATVRSVAHGFPLITRTYNSQGPLFIYGAELFYKLSPTITSVRLFPVLCSLWVIYLTFKLTDKHIGRTAALFSAAYLALDSTFLTVSRTFQIDIPWLAFTLASFYFLLNFHQTQLRRDILLSAVCFALSIFLKVNPLFVPIIIAYFVILTRERGIRYWTNILFYPFALLVVMFLIFHFRDIPVFYLNAVHVRTAHITLVLSSWTVGTRNVLLIHEWPLLLVVALSLIFTRRSNSLEHSQALFFRQLSIVWLISTLVGFSFYDPLFPHHVVFLILPAVLIAAWQIEFAFSHNRALSIVFSAAIIAYALLQGGKFPITIRPRANVYNQAELAVARDIASQTTPNEYIISDDPLLLYLANRNTPPELVDPSFVRIESGLLTGDDLITLTNKYHPKYVIFASGRFNHLPAYRLYLDQNFKQSPAGEGIIIFTPLH